MKESSPRFVAPMSTPRPRGARLLTAFSPKLGRTVRAFDHAAFEQWVRLEPEGMDSRRGFTRAVADGEADDTGPRRTGST